MRKLKGWQRIVVGSFAICISLFHLYTVLTGVMDPRLQRSVHLTFLLVICFALFPATKKSPKDKITLMDALLSLMAFVSGMYIIINHYSISFRMEHITKLLPIEIILGTIAVIVLIEGIRRAVSPTMTALIVVFIIYMFVARYLPGILYFRGMPYERVIEKFYLLANEGIYGFITGVSATYIALFIIFGAFIQSSGVGEFFLNVANAIAGRSIGGPAKVATLSSGMFASISGSGTANVFATGTFTIPLMKSLGYEPHFAGAVEAVASTGGMIMPPVMGATAFVIAEITGIPYIKVCFAALVPALLYYLSLMLMIHFEAVKLGLKGMPKEKIISWKALLKDIYLSLPIFVIIYFLVKGFSPMIAAFYGIISSLLVSIVNKKNRINFIKFLEILENGGKNMVIVALACAGAGIVISIIAHSSVGLTVSSVIMAISKGNLIICLILVAITAIILGMGLPATPAYVITITTGSTILIKLGCDLLSSHLFVFYFAILAAVTPPVAICAYAAASIANSEPMKTGYTAFRLSFTGFLVPFLFFFDHGLLLQGSFLEIFYAIMKGIIVAIFIASAVVGVVQTIKLSYWERIIFIIISLIIIFPIFNISQPILNWSRILLIILVMIIYSYRLLKAKENTT